MTTLDGNVERHQAASSALSPESAPAPAGAGGSLPELAVAGAVQMAQRSSQEGPSHAFPAAVPPVVSRLIGDSGFVSDSRFGDSKLFKDTTLFTDTKVFTDTAPLTSPVGTREPTASAEPASRRPDLLPVPVMRLVEQPPATLFSVQRDEPTRSPEMVGDVPVTATAQRQDEPVEPAPPATEAAGPVEHAAPAAAASVAGAPATAPPETDELVRKLFDPLLRRLKTELRLDRERRGALTDRRH
jgi:hypothetical protein